MLSKPLTTLRTSLVCTIPLLAAASLAQTTINVGPGQTYTTIQSGINAAVNGDTVLVAPGTYYENINFNGKAITVTSSGGAASTIIDGGATAPAVQFVTGETRSSVLSGFTVQHGGTLNNSFQMNGGIYLYGSSPTIQNNTLTQNNCWTIYANLSAPLIQNNVISATEAPYQSCSFGSGAAIFLSGNANGGGTTTSSNSALILGNTIENNVDSGLEDAGGNGGAGVAVWGGSPIIMNNAFYDNASPGGSGGAINVEAGTGVAIVQNLIYDNSAGCGGGALAFDGYTDARTGIAVLIANNTIVDNTDRGYPAGYSNCAPIAQIYPGPEQYGASSPAVTLINNILSGSTSYPSVNCSSIGGPFAPSQPTFEYNILHNAGGPFFGSYCVDVSGQDNNNTADPQFVSPSTYNYQLQSSSPAIGAGQDSVVQTFFNLTGMSWTTDFLGYPRIQNPGNGCLIDMGAYEHQLSGLHNSCLTFETLTSSLNPSDYSNTVTFTATMTSGSGVPTGSVEFDDGGNYLATEIVSNTGVASYSTNTLTTGTHLITATYQPSGVLFTPASANLSQVVLGEATNTNVVCQVSPIILFGTTQLIATVTSKFGTPMGAVAFVDNGGQLGQSIPLVNGTASMTYTGQVAGSHTIVANYIAYDPFGPSSGSCVEVVTADPSVSALTVAPTSFTYGTPVTLTATVSPASPPGAGTPDGGTVSFSAVGAGTLGNPVALVNGVASTTVANIPVSASGVTCVFSGNTLYGASNCNTVPVSVSAQTSSLTLSSSQNPAPVLTTVTFTATLMVNGNAAGAGQTISLSLNGQTIPLRTNASGVASYSISTLAPGSYPVTASFAGNANVQAASAGLTEVINALPTVTVLAVSPNPQYATLPVTMTANVSVSGGAITSGTVTFLDGTTPLATQPVTAGSAAYTTTMLAVGTHPITATYNPASVDYLTSSSSVVNEVILASGFTIALSPTTLTLAPGATGTDAISLTSVGNFSGALALTYGTLPMYATASLSPATVTLTAGGTGGSTFTLKTLLRAANTMPDRPGSRELPVIFTAFLLLFAPLGMKRRRMFRGILRVVVLLVSLQAILGCTNAWYNAEVVAPGTYPLPITATDIHGNTQTATLTVVVTH